MRSTKSNAEREAQGLPFTGADLHHAIMLVAVERVRSSAACAKSEPVAGRRMRQGAFRATITITPVSD